MEREPTVNQPSQIERENSLRAFQEKIAGFAGEELKSAMEHGHGTAHFLKEESDTPEIDPNFNATELTEEDEEIWNAIQTGSIDLATFRAYAEKMTILNEQGKMSTSRVIFSAFAANKAMKPIAEKRLRELALQKKELPKTG